jgi:hypothetical protein
VKKFLKMKPCHAMLACLGLIFLLSSACAAPPSPLAQDLRMVKPGMNLKQVEAILGKYRTQEKDQDGGTAHTAKCLAAPPLGRIDKSLITYPLDDQTTGSSTRQRTYHARTRRGDWEYAVIDFQAGHIAAVHLLR